MVNNYLSGQCRPAESNQFSHTASPNGNLQLDSFVSSGGLWHLDLSSKCLADDSVYVCSLSLP